MSEGTPVVLTGEELDRLAEIAVARGIPASRLVAEYIEDGISRVFSRDESPLEAVTVH